MRQRILLIVLGLVVVFGVFEFLDVDKEPRDESTRDEVSLWEWLSIYENTGIRGDLIEQEQSMAAIRGMGTNALPYLIDWLNTSEGNIKASDIRLQILLSGNTNWQPDRIIQTRQLLAEYGFEILGTNGAPAIPELMKLLRGPNKRVAHYSARCLGHIGTPVSPGFLEWFMAAHPGKAELISNSLLIMETNFIPSLVCYLGHPDSVKRERATTLLVKMSGGSFPAVAEEVSRCLNQPQPYHRIWAIHTLFEYEANAQYRITNAAIVPFTLYVSNRVLHGTSRTANSE